MSCPGGTGAKIILDCLLGLFQLCLPLGARVHMFSNIGKLALKVASALEQANVKAMSGSRKAITPEKRREIAGVTLKNQFHEVEVKYRSSLVLAAGCSDLDMPELAYPKAKGSSGILLVFF